MMLQPVRGLALKRLQHQTIHEGASQRYLPHFAAATPSNTTSKRVLKGWRRWLAISMSTLFGLSGSSYLIARYSPLFRREFRGEIGNIDNRKNPARYYSSPQDPADYSNYGDGTAQEVLFSPESIVRDLKQPKAVFTAENHPTLLKLREIEAMRAKFNTAEARYRETGDLKMLSEGLNLFNPYLRYRNQLAKTTPEKLAAHDEKIKNLADNPLIAFYFVDNQDTANVKRYHLDNSTKFLIAARIMDLMHNRNHDLVANRLRAGDAPLNLLFYKTLDHQVVLKNGHFSGYYALENGDVGLDHASTWLSLTNGYDPAPQDIHELTHYFSATYYPVLQLYIPNGFGYLPALSEMDKTIVREEYKRLKHKHQRYLKEKAPIIKELERLNEVLKPYHQAESKFNEATQAVQDLAAEREKIMQQQDRLKQDSKRLEDYKQTLSMGKKTKYAGEIQLLENQLSQIRENLSQAEERIRSFSGKIEAVSQQVSKYQREMAERRDEKSEKAHKSLQEKLYQLEDTRINDHGLTYLWEFVAETVAMFYGNPKLLQMESPFLFEVYKQYYGWNPLINQDLPNTGAPDATATHSQ